MNELNILYYPQDNLSKEERKINILYLQFFKYF